MTTVITVSNAGNVTATGHLAVALSARAAGTDGTLDVALATVTVKVKINFNASGCEKLSFVVPSTLPTGTYSLVAQLDPATAYKDSSPPSPIISTQTFAVA